MAFVNWQEIQVPQTDNHGSISPATVRHEAVRNGLVLATVTRIPFTHGEETWRGGLWGLSPVPSLNAHPFLRERFGCSGAAQASAEDYLGRWLLAMDMTWVNPVDFDG
jgi:hypothetical protein